MENATPDTSLSTWHCTITAMAGRKLSKPRSTL